MRRNRNSPPAGSGVDSSSKLRTSSVISPTGRLRSLQMRFPSDIIVLLPHEVVGRHLRVDAWDAFSRHLHQMLGPRSNPAFETIRSSRSNAMAGSYRNSCTVGGDSKSHRLSFTKTRLDSGRQRPPIAFDRPGGSGGSRLTQQRARRTHLPVVPTSVRCARSVRYEALVLLRGAEAAVLALEGAQSGVRTYS